MKMRSVDFCWRLHAKVSVQGTFTDRPSIRYRPQTGEMFLRGFITPIRNRSMPAKNSTAVVFFQREDMSAAMMEKTAEIRRLLKLAPDQHKLVLIYSPMRGAPNELAVNSRSMLQVMNAFASYIDVPEAHRKELRLAEVPATSGPAEAREQVRIRSGKEKPSGAFTAVRYRDHWFWVDQEDWRTKRALAAVMLLFTLADTGGNERLPLITIPAQ